MTKVLTSKTVVLAVDDSPDILAFLSDTLSPEGMTTLVALDGEQAINIAENMLPNIILLDGIMPKLDGFETCKKIKKITSLKNIPIIFMTGLSDTESIVKGFNVGGIDYLTKPINPKELVVRIQTHLQQSQSIRNAQNILDNTGQNVFSFNRVGELTWSTPEVEKILDRIMNNETYKAFIHTINEWTNRQPDIGNKCHFSKAKESITVIYLGTADNNEHLIRLMTESHLNEKEQLLNKFSITPREADVFLWLAKGKTNREIAQILDMSPRTVNKHLEQLFKKLNVENRTAAAGLALACFQKFSL